MRREQAVCNGRVLINFREILKIMCLSMYACQVNTADITDTKRTHRWRPVDTEQMHIRHLADTWSKVRPGQYLHDNPPIPAGCRDVMEKPTLGRYWSHFLPNISHDTGQASPCCLTRSSNLFVHSFPYVPGHSVRPNKVAYCGNFTFPRRCTVVLHLYRKVYCSITRFSIGIKKNRTFFKRAWALHHSSKMYHYTLKGFGTVRLHLKLWDSPFTPKVVKTFSV